MPGPRPLPGPSLGLLLAASVLLPLSCRGDTPPGPPYDLEATALAESSRRGPLVAELRTAADRLRVRPEDLRAHLVAGRAAMLLDRADGARWHFERALRSPETAAEAHYQLGVLELRLSRPDEAVAAFRAAVELDPGFAGGHRDLGRALTDAGEPQAARAALERAVALDPRDADAAALLALALADADAPRATGLLEAAIAADPYHLSAHTNLAALYRRLGRADDADRMRDRHRDLVVLADLGQLERPEEPDRYLAEAQYYAKLGHWPKAAEVCAAGLARHPRAAELHFLDGMVDAHRGDADGARDAYLRSLELRPGDRRVLEELAALFEGEAPPEATPAARRALAEARERWPDEPRFRRATETLAFE